MRAGSGKQGGGDGDVEQDIAGILRASGFLVEVDGRQSGLSVGMIPFPFEPGHSMRHFWNPTDKDLWFRSYGERLKDLARFCERATRHLGDLIGMGCTINEPNTPMLISYSLRLNGGGLESLFESGAFVTEAPGVTSSR